MKKILLFILLIQCFLQAQPQGIRPDGPKEKFSLSPNAVPSKDFLPNTIIVKFKSSAFEKSANLSAQGKAGIPALSAVNISVVSVRKKFPTQALRTRSSAAQKGSDFGLDRIYEIKYEGADSIEKVINDLLKNDGVEYAEPSYIYKTSYHPNDPEYISGRQPYLDQINAIQAWDIRPDASGIIIAIVDSGSELTHPDLAANIYYNLADPEDGKDNDGDGYIDNFRGWDFVGASGKNPVEDNDPNVKFEGGSHGIHVSGIASAVSDNAIGIASIAFNAKLLIIKAGDDMSKDDIYAGPEGIKYAADHGAHIINCSWGSTNRSAYVQDVVNYAINRGCLIVAAAGNMEFGSTNNQPDYPAAYPGVLAVANVNSNDIKNTSSKYGEHVSISAPGTAIYSTVFNSGYASMTGTSMAAPLVSSAAALVKAAFPELSMYEVGQLLRAAADNIDSKNPNYAGLLGSGRLNVFRALTEKPPSIRKQAVHASDNKNNTFLPGDTISLFFDLKNFLYPAYGLQVSLTSNNPYVNVLNGAQIVGTINTDETKTGVGPFTVLVQPGTPDNTSVNFNLSYKADNDLYEDHETFTIDVALDYINYEQNHIATTISSVGRLGYSQTDSRNGMGFQYDNKQLLYEASLMIGSSSMRVSNNARSTNLKSDEHFIKKIRAQTLHNSEDFFEAAASFDDSGSPQSLKIFVKNRHLAYPDAPDDKYIITEYTIINQNEKALNNLYAGLFTDWDIDDPDNNVTQYDEVNRMGYAYSKKPGTVYAGVKLLTPAFSPSYYPMSISLSNDLLQNGFTIAEKFQTLSSGIKASGLGADAASGYDIMYTIGYGPFDIPPHDSVKISFAFIAGENLNGLQQSAVAVQKKFSIINSVEPPLSESEIILRNFPNPSTGYTTLEFSVPVDGNLSLILYDLAGRKVKAIADDKYYSRGAYQIPLNLTDLENGIYICRLRINNSIKSAKISVFR